MNKWISFCSSNIFYINENKKRKSEIMIDKNNNLNNIYKYNFI